MNINTPFPQIEYYAEEVFIPKVHEAKPGQTEEFKGN